MDFIPIPESSLFHIGVTHQTPEKEDLDQHHSVLIVSLTNNQKILNGADFDQKWVFQVDEFNDDFKKGYLGKHLKLVERQKIADLTGMITAIDPSCQWILACVLPLHLLHEQGDPIGKLTNIISISASFSLRNIPNFLNYDSIIKQIKAENNRFWKEHRPDSSLITRAFVNRRFRNDDFAETDDYSSIQNIPVPQRIDGYEFLEENNNKSGANDGLDFTGQLRQAMGIKPLEQKDYESYLTYLEMDQLFRTVAIFENSKEIMIDLFQIFLKSFYCCHLIFHNPFIMRKFKIIYQFLDDERSEKLMVEINRSLIWGLYTLYAEELLLGGNLNPNHRSIWNQECASHLPIHSGVNIYDSPYLCLPIAPKAMSLHANLIGLPRMYPFHFGNRESSFMTDFKKTGIRRKGINSVNKVRTSMIIFTDGLLEELDDSEIFLTGSGAEACLYNNPVFHSGDLSIEDIYPTRELGLNDQEPTHKHSDIDLVVFTDQTEVLEEKMEKVKNCLQMNLGDMVEVIKVNDFKYRFTSPKMKREVDLFMTYKNPAALMYNYHITTCRAAIPFGNSDIVSHQSFLMTSMILSSHLGFCIDRRWFSSKTSLYDRICRQLSRGIGMMLNVAEIQMLKNYQNSSDKWRYMNDMIEIVIFQNNPQPQTQGNSYIKTYLPYVSSPFFKKVKKHHVGQFFKGSNYVKVGLFPCRGSIEYKNFNLYHYDLTDDFPLRDKYGNII